MERRLNLYYMVQDNNLKKVPLITSIKHHNTQKCKTAMWNLQRLKAICPFLTTEACLQSG